MFRLEFDGLFRTADDERPASAGIMCYGWRILRGKRVIAQGHGTFARGRNANSNIAEYLALVEGLEALLDMGVTHERVLVCGDAKSVINQMEGVAGVSSPAVRSLHERARKLAAAFPNLRWEWLPRRHNRAADALSRHAFKRLRHDPARYESILEKVRTSRLAGRLVDVGGLRVYQPA
ncbi:MAG: ribonuclease HI family protein [Anaerolineales bacterium]|nr:ribonuclease HI family protein [Anaerolineales bacterium]MDW8276705.1 ribonuclease HI family protein [Anaerolineales bacterium]